MYTLSVVLLGLFIVPWFLLLDTGTSWGIMLATIVPPASAAPSW
jgi:hypothetical protein